MKWFIDGLYMKNELVKYALPKMNKKSNYLGRVYIEFDIFVWTPFVK